MNQAFDMSADSEGAVLLKRLDERGERVEGKVDKMHVLIVGDGVTVGMAEVQRNHGEWIGELRTRMDKVEKKTALYVFPETPVQQAETWKAKAIIWGAVATVFLAVMGGIIDLLNILKHTGGP